MTRKLKVGAGATAFLAAFGAGAWLSGTGLGLQGNDLLLYRVGLIALGFIATLAIVWFVLRRPETPAPKTDEGKEIDSTVSLARSRLASSRQSGAAGLHKLPVVLILGPEGSTKTTAIVRSGLDPELLAGEVFRGETVAPTRSVNLWYSQQTVLVEASGRVTGDSTRWMRLVRHLHPKRLRAALSRGSPAPRSAVVCLSCEEFLRPNSAETVPASARQLRTRLADLALELGTSVPVYVLFTKADRLPHFAEYVRNFSRDEAHDVLGATVPLDYAGSGSYAEGAFKRIDSALQGLFFSLASKRLKFLPRENQSEAAASAYEFPREFRKLIPMATEFLVELCRPSQLAVSPVLRGFYFVGVRPVVVADAGFEVGPQAAEGTGESIRIGATNVFNPGQAAAAVAPRLAQPVASSRKIPQWVFLNRVFPEVILADRVALAMTRGRRRVHVMRRLMLAGVIVLSLSVAAGFLISYLGNRRLQDSMAEAKRNVASIRLSGALPSLQDLSQLEALRDKLGLLSEYERNGAPWHLRLGLYTGSALYPELRRSYFEGFKGLLLAGTRDSLLRQLRNLPDAPDAGSDYESTYNALKAYLIITAHPEQSTVGFLSPVLFSHWAGAKQSDRARGDLARRQFDFYAGELRGSNPYRATVDQVTVSRARTFLSQFAGTERIYRSVLSQALSGLPPVDFMKQFPGAAGVVRDTFVVPGAFTRAGWAAMRKALKDVDRFFQGETWVIGEQAPALTDRKKVLAQLQALYERDYVSHWRNFLAAASVERFGSIAEGARKLGPLSGNQSPLLAMFSLISRNTALDSLGVAGAFQPVHAVTPPGDTAKYIGPSNEGYVNALVALQSSLEQIAKGPPDAAEAAVSQALSDAAQARLATKQLANKFQPDRTGRVHASVESLMEAPIRYAETALQSFGPAQLNGKGRAFCAPFQQLLAKFPFNYDGEATAGVDEISALLQPGTGALWSFVENDLANYIVRQGPRFAEKPGGAVGISPGFIAFLNRAADFSNTLYGPEGGSMGLTFRMRPVLSDEVSSLTVTVDGRPARFTRSSTAGKVISWTPGEGQEASLSGEVLGEERQIYSFTGPWALFKLFNRGEWSESAGSYVIEWPIPNASPLRATFRVNFAQAEPILRRNFFSGVSCTGRITR